MRILIVFGTRPEILKLYPLIKAFEEAGYKNNITVLNAGQHQEILNPFIDILDIEVSDSLQLMEQGQSLSGLTAKAFVAFQNYLERSKEKPDVIIAQGDTTTVMVVSLVAFYNKIDFGHVEAGLRSHDYDHPFPEELNRRIASLTTKYHFAPTSLAKDNLLKEGIKDEDIYVVGNTIVDTIERMRPKMDSIPFSSGVLKNIHNKKNIVLITCHRRENHGDNLNKIIEAVHDLATEYPNLNFLWPVHPNPNVGQMVMKSLLPSMQNVFITDPISYTDILKIYGSTKIIITDSGGLQEESPSFKIPSIVVRNTTERPEAMMCGYSTLTGADTGMIKAAFKRFITSVIDIKENPYGNGKASEKIVELLVEKLEYR